MNEENLNEDECYIKKMKDKNKLLITQKGKKKKNK